MKKLFVVVAATFLVSTAAIAQDTAPAEPSPKVLMLQSSVASPAGTVTTGGMFFSAELPGSGKLVTGAPYTATSSTESTQILGDGNRIVNKTSASLARDSQGRTRREESMGMVGPWQVNGPKLVFINDPVAQTNYILDANRQTATSVKMAMPNFAPGQAGVSFGPMPAGPNVTFSVRKSGAAPQDDAKIESLGVQSMEGVVVEGKRTTRTIPAGQIGNVDPIVSTSEVWFSPDLQVVVMSKHSDPRFGETVYQLTGINRAEPDRSLFEVPAGYTVKNMPGPALLPPGAMAVEPFQPVIGGEFGPVGK